MTRKRDLRLPRRSEYVAPTELVVSWSWLIYRYFAPSGANVRLAYFYVLEYTGANGGHDEGWLPRIRKVSADGKVSTSVTGMRNNHRDAEAQRFNLRRQ